MDWLRIDSGLPEHPKVARLADELRVRDDVALAIVVRLLCWTARVSESGDLGCTTEARLCSLARLPGPPARTVAALISVGLLERSDGRLVVHDWSDVQGPMLRARDRMREYRLRQRAHTRDANESVTRDVTRDVTDSVTRSGNQPTNQPTDQKSPPTPRTRGATAAADGAGSIRRPTRAERKAEAARWDEHGRCRACGGRRVQRVERAEHGQIVTVDVPCRSCSGQGWRDGPRVDEPADEPAEDLALDSVFGGAP